MSGLRVSVATPRHTQLDKFGATLKAGKLGRNETVLVEVARAREWDWELEIAVDCLWFELELKFEQKLQLRLEFEFQLNFASLEQNWAKVAAK